MESSFQWGAGVIFAQSPSPRQPCFHGKPLFRQKICAQEKNICLFVKNAQSRRTNARRHTILSALQKRWQGRGSAPPDGQVQICTALCRGRRPCRPDKYCGFAADFRKSAAFCGRTESSAPTMEWAGVCGFAEDFRKIRCILRAGRVVQPYTENGRRLSFFTLRRLYAPVGKRLALHGAEDLAFEIGILRLQ